MAEKSSAELLKEYKDLLDQGIITQEEFEAKKKQLIENVDAGTRSGVTVGGGNPSLSTRGTNIVAYITWIGWIIAFLVGDRENCKFHLNQALVLNIASLLAIIPVIGWILAIVVFIGWIIGIMGAVRGQENKVPVLGDLQLLK